MKLDVTTGGGGVRVGGFLAPRWTIELGVDIGANQASQLVASSSSAPLGSATIGAFVGTPTGETQNRIIATSVLVGYHPPTRGRMRAGFRGG
jgi:hypothetical protein